MTAGLPSVTSLKSHRDSLAFLYATEAIHNIINHIEERRNTMREIGKTSKIFMAGCLLLSLVLGGNSDAQAQFTPADLNNWTEESYPAVAGFDPGVWTVSGDGYSVLQSINGQPTLFYSDFPVFDTEVEGTIEVVTTVDDDFIGFALGFQPGDTTNSNADYLLVDWKQATQFFNFGTPSCTPGRYAPAGLAVSRVLAFQLLTNSGAIPISILCVRTRTMVLRNWHGASV